TFPMESPSRSVAAMGDRSSWFNIAASSVFTMWPGRGKAELLVLGMVFARILVAGGDVAVILLSSTTDNRRRFPKRPDRTALGIFRVTPLLTPSPVKPGRVPGGGL